MAMAALGIRVQNKFTIDDVSEDFREITMSRVQGGVPPCNPWANSTVSIANMNRASVLFP